MDAFLQALLPVVAALGGVWLTNRHQRTIEEKRADREDERARTERRQRLSDQSHEEKKALYDEFVTYISQWLERYEATYIADDEDEAKIALSLEVLGRRAFIARIHLRGGSDIAQSAAAVLDALPDLDRSNSALDDFVIMANADLDQDRPTP